MVSVNYLHRLGWGIIILMGGGFALADGMDKYVGSHQFSYSYISYFYLETQTSNILYNNVFQMWPQQVDWRTIDVITGTPTRKQDFSRSTNTISRFQLIPLFNRSQV